MISEVDQRVAVSQPHAQACDDWQSRYLDELASTGSKGDSAVIAGVNIRTVQRERKRNAAFASAEGDVLREALDVVETEIRRRAINGVTQEKVTRDGKVIVETTYSDTLILRLAERLETGTWKQTQKVTIETGKTFDTATDRGEALKKVKGEVISDSQIQRVIPENSEIPTNE